jgi:hypothetical protein
MSPSPSSTSATPPSAVEYMTPEIASRLARVADKSRS